MPEHRPGRGAVSPTGRVTPFPSGMLEAMGRRRSTWTLALALWASGCDAQRAATPDAGPVACEPPTVMPATCNGSAALCARAFDQVAYGTSHNAMSNVVDGFALPNQNLSMTSQLELGVRALMLDTHDYGGAPYLCHAFCELGEIPLADGLFEIAEFLRCHPAEVISIIFESYISAEETLAGFEQSGLLDYVYAHPPGTAWPTLREMIDANTRLLVMTDNEGGTYAWYHDVWALAWETPFSAATPADLGCTLGRGNPANDLFILNHFLTGTLGASPDLATMVNYDPFLIDHATSCQATFGHIPNFVTLDFVDIGDLVAAVDTLNGV